MRIQTVFLDAGGVLVVPNWRRIADTLAAHGVETTPEALARADPHARFDLDVTKGRNASDQQRGWLYFNLVLEKAGVALTHRTEAALAELHAYHEQVNLWEQVPDGVVEALDRMRRAGLRLVVVSNSNGRLRVLFDRLGLSRKVDAMLDSQEEGVEKPDRRLFDLALERTAAARESTLHAGDLYYVDVEGARAAGLRAVLIDPLGLYRDFDCERVASLGELADRLLEAGLTPES
ncbi:MAG TPA: HAD-IA family hydrolase [Vicinamibacterales bacterium]|nr:HAD-IA family hydrolase [Vicinamibacterales bacterium]